MSEDRISVELFSQLRVNGRAVPSSVFGHDENGRVLWTSSTVRRSELDDDPGEFLAFIVGGFSEILRIELAKLDADRFRAWLDNVERESRQFWDGGDDADSDGT